MTIETKARTHKQDVKNVLKWLVGNENDGMLNRTPQPFSALVSLRADGFKVTRYDCFWALEYSDKCVGETVATFPRRYSGKTGRELVPSVSL